MPGTVVLLGEKGSEPLVLFQGEAFGAVLDAVEAIAAEAK
jgi:hypothetical protein